MQAVRIVAERAPYLLLARDNRYAVVERRAGRLYALHGVRASAPMSDAGVDDVVGNDWSDKKRAQRLFNDLVVRYAELAERLW